MYLLGIDIGSSSVKAAIVRASDKKVMASVQHPEGEMKIEAKHARWAEQDPEMWWHHVQQATKLCIQQSGVDGQDIRSIGITYQMHGLVLIDKNHEVLRPSIIWCDSRAVAIGDAAFSELGSAYCLDNYLNSPGNFTASKLKWVKENEPNIFSKIYKIMLPGDYINMKLTGSVNTTITGLSEGVFWNFPKHGVANELLSHYGIDSALIPEYTTSLSVQGQVRTDIAKSLGLGNNVEVTYRAGDQANNAMSLGVLEPNQVAATGGTSGVIYGVTDSYKTDAQSRVNSFAHVNHNENEKRLGVLLCLNGAGIQYAWAKNQIAQANESYEQMERSMSEIPVGSDGLRLYPFGNGAERMLGNKAPGAHVANLQFNIHTRKHIYRAALEGIAFSFNYGFEIMKTLGLNPSVIRVGNDNLFRSKVFSETIANLLNTSIEIRDTNGAVGAAKASGVAVGIYSNLTEAMEDTSIERVIEPSSKLDSYRNAYFEWQNELEQIIN